MGLNNPLFLNFGALPEQGVTGLYDVQYFTFMMAGVRLDFGLSIYPFVPVSSWLMQPFPATLELAVFAMLFAVIVGIPLGVIAALRRGTIIDTIVTVIALAGVSFPVFWLGIIMIYFFAVNLGWLPSSGRIGVTMAIGSGTGLYVLDGLLQGRPEFTLDALRHLIMPAIAVGTIQIGRAHV